MRGSKLAQAARRVAGEYAARVGAFKPNARLYLLSVIIYGAAMGVFRLLFNFYVLSLGYDEALLGKLVTVSSLTALLAALPCGYLADLLGRKISLLLSAGLTGLSILGMVLWPQTEVLYLTNILFGLASSLGAVTMGPFLMENSGEQERTYLFSFSLGLQMASGSVGNWIGGYLPTWVAEARGLQPTENLAYAGALLVVAGAVGLSMLPLTLMRMPRLRRTDRSVFAPMGYAAEHPVLLTKLILPMLLTSIGAGLIMPFMNVFYRQVYHQPDTVIGTLFAWGSLAMGLGLLVAPPLAERMGKIQLVVVSQALSIPFLAIMGFSPWFWLSTVAYYIRVALMNMSAPVYETFVMEHVEQEARATVASLVSMAWNFGWAFSPMISGWLQVSYGFAPAFLGTLFLYSISIVLYWAFFWRRPVQAVPATMSAD
jgi:MFS family permease